MNFLAIPQNEQITVRKDAGLTLGTWVIRIQAKLLPLAAHQAYGLVITGDAIVTPPAQGLSPSPISSTLLLKCPSK